jgi:hypothetical protein
MTTKKGPVFHTKIYPIKKKIPLYLGHGRINEYGTRIMVHGESAPAHGASRRSCAFAVISGAVLITTFCHVRTGAHPMLLGSARGSGNLVSTLLGETRGVDANSGDTRGVAAPSEDRGPFSCMLPPFSPN